MSKTRNSRELNCMGMCPRQERIKKDIDIVIKRCKAQNDCLFSDFRYTDATFTFTYVKGSKRVSYSVHVSEDYPDNTLVSNSENSEDVLVTTDPIPVIFHKIETEIRIKSDAISCLSVRSKLPFNKNQCLSATEEDSEGDNDLDEFYYGSQVYYDGETGRHPQLEADLVAVRELYGHHVVSLREYGEIDDVDIDLHIDVTFLDEEIALAWDVIRREPVIVRLHCSLTQYLNGPVPTVDVFQVSTKDRFGLGHQLKKIMQTFVTQQWKYHSTDRRTSPLSKTETEGKAKSPLHIFSTLCRSPSYPPPGCVKCKNKLNLIGVAKPHKMLHRSCSSTVKAEEECVSGSHSLVNRSESSGSPRPCPPVDPPVERRSATLRHRRPLGPSCPNAPWPAEPGGFKHPRLLSLSKEPHSRGRRRSLSLGIMGILTPTLSTAHNTNHDAKSIPTRDRGFLVQTVEYAAQRIPVLNEYCVVCDEPHVFQNGPMLRPTVCERELCVFAFQTLGVMNEAADQVATGVQVVDLLVSICRSALESPRKVVIFKPYPSVVDPHDPQTLAFNPRKKDYGRVMRALDSLTSIREMTQAPYLEIKKQMDKQDPLAHPLLQWVISSNRSHIVKLPGTRRLKFMHTPHQFLLLSSPPAKESNFRAAKSIFGSTFAFHGSYIENWHSILRNGLVVASNTRLQLHGAVYGSGIYLSPMSSISFGYSGMNKKKPQKLPSKDETFGNCKSSINLQSHRKGRHPQFLQSENLRCIALCEVITSPDLQKHSDIWVVPNTDHVCTRFFFVYEDGQVSDTSINSQDPSIHREILRVIGNQTATG